MINKVKKKIREAAKLLNLNIHRITVVKTSQHSAQIHITIDTYTYTCYANYHNNKIVFKAYIKANGFTELINELNK